MPNTIPAAAEGLPKFNRRRFLLNTATAGAALAVAVPAVPAVAEAKADVSARERFAFHLAELKKAAEELDPRIGSWHVARSEDDDLACALLIAASRVTGRYAGNGVYEKGEENALGGQTLYHVRLLRVRIDGHRAFDVRNPMDRMMLAEPRLNTFIGRRVS